MYAWVHVQCRHTPGDEASMQWPVLATLQKHLHMGYFNHIFRLSQLYLCAQGMLLNRFSWKFIEKLPLYLVASPEDQFGYIPGISTTRMQPRNSPCRDCMQDQTSPECWFIGILKGDNKKGEASQLHSVRIVALLELYVSRTQRNTTEVT